MDSRAALLLFIPAIAAITWNGPDANGIWASGCDFSNGNLANSKTAASGCGPLCRQNAGCTHYAWTTLNGGTCWMKQGFAYKQNAIVNTAAGALCGIKPVINWGSNDWAFGCDWVGMDLKNTRVPANQCGPTCAATTGCTHYTWTNFNGGTCWMKNGAVTKANAISSYDNTMVCGIVGNVPPPPPPPVTGRQITIKNNCPHPVWIATLTNGQLPPIAGTIKLNNGQSNIYSIPASGWAGRFWPKTGCNEAGTYCNFGDSSGSCGTNCNQPPAETKIEFNLPVSGDSFYDVSLVDGYSLPAKIVPRGPTGVLNFGSCVTTNCALSIAACPTNENNGLGDLRVKGRDGQYVACLSPCKKWNFPPPYGLGRSETVSPGLYMCCPGNMVDQCRAGPVVSTQFVNLVHQQCPSAYSYAYDDLAGNHNCPGQTTSYDVTICP